MTIPEITAYVMALPVEDVRRLSATDVMGWEYWYGGVELRWSEPCDHIREKCTKKYVMLQSDWRPDEDRNQSRVVTDKVGHLEINEAMKLVTNNTWPGWYWLTPDHETRAALIAHMIHTQEAMNSGGEN